MNTVTPQAANPSSHPDANPPARQEPALLPPVDVIEDASGITLVADLPGVPRERMSLRVDGDQFTLEGEIVVPTPADATPTHAEVGLARFRRAFTLSRELDASRVTAECSQGVLRVRIPKAAQAQPRRIEVQVR